MSRGNHPDSGSRDRSGSGSGSYSPSVSPTRSPVENSREGRRALLSRARSSADEELAAARAAGLELFDADDDEPDTGVAKTIAPILSEQLERAARDTERAPTLPDEETTK